MDIGERYTEAQMKQIERRLKSIYKEAEQDVGRKLREFNKAHKERDAKYRAAVKAGEMSKEDYQAWLRGQVFQGEQWKAKRAQMAKSLYNANEQAMAIVNGTRFNVFAENANFMEYEIGMGAGLTGAQFGLYDARTVQRLVADDPKLLPPSKVSYPKDMAWNMKKLNNALTQGIIQGEGIDDIAQRMANVTGSSRKAMVLHARTAMTGAQNAGRLEGMRAAERLGLKVKKQWMATLDNRTRDSHQVLDGQVQDIDKPFDSILGPIMHPGDPSADPANVYNCRCTLIYVFDDESFSGERRDEEADEDIEYKTYQEWKASQQTAQPEETQAAPAWKSEQEYREARAKRQAVYDAALADAEKEFAEQKEALMEEYGGNFMMQRIAIRSDDSLTDEEKAEKLTALRVKEQEMKAKREVLSERRDKQMEEAVARYNAVFDPEYEYAKIKGAHTLAQDASAINPNYFRDFYCTVNCQRCGVGLEMRMRGYDVEALPAPEQGAGAMYTIKQIFHGAEEVSFEGSGHDNTIRVRKQMAEWGNGSRCIIGINRRDGSGHIFNAQYKDGVFTLIDSQLGGYWDDKEKGASIEGGALEELSTFAVTVIRTDNVAVSDIPTDWIRSRSKK